MYETKVSLAVVIIFFISRLKVMANVSTEDSDLGVVPLINLYGDYQFAEKWRFILDFDGLVGAQGRAIDLCLKVQYDINRQCYVGVGVRTLRRRRR